MAPHNYMFHFRRRTCRQNRKDEGETEITLSSGSLLLVAILILAALVAAGVIPSDVFARVMEQVLAR